jgi:gliding motility-associated-like protein
MNQILSAIIIRKRIYADYGIEYIFVQYRLAKLFSLLLIAMSLFISISNLSGQNVESHTKCFYSPQDLTIDSFSFKNNHYGWSGNNYDYYSEFSFLVGDSFLYNFRSFRNFWGLHMQLDSAFLNKYEYIVLEKYNIYTKESFVQKIKPINAAFGYRATFIRVVKDSLDNFYFSFYLDHNVYNTIYKTVISKFNSNLQHIWTINSNTRQESYDGSFLCIVDTFFYSVTFINNENLLSKFSCNSGKLLKSVILDSKYKYTNFVGIHNEIDKKLRIVYVNYPNPRRFTYILDFDLKPIDVYYDTFVNSNFFGNKNFKFNTSKIKHIEVTGGYGELHLRDYQKLKAYLIRFDQYFYDNYYYNNYWWNGTNNTNVVLNEDKTISISYFPRGFKQFKTVKKLRIASDWKTVIENKVYLLPNTKRHDTTYCSPYNSSIDCDYYYNGNSYYNWNDLRQTSITDSSFIITHDNYFHSMYENTLIKNFDFGHLPMANPTCDSFQIILDSMNIINLPLISVKDTSHNISQGFNPLTFNNFVKSQEYMPEYNTKGYFFTAKFALKRDTFCKESINLYSDSSSKFSVSRWIINYLDSNKRDTIQRVNVLNYSLKYAGNVRINHTVDYLGCLDSFSVKVYVKDFVKENLNIGNDTALCPPFSFQKQINGFTTSKFRWSTGDTVNSINVSDTGIYWVTINDFCGMQSDTFIVDYKTKRFSGPIFNPKSLVICPDKLPYTLTSQLQGSSYKYRWSNGDTSKSLNLDSFRKMIITVTDNCHTYKDSFNLLPLQVITPPTIPDSISLCLNAYNIMRPIGLKLEQLSNNVSLWVERDSIIVGKNQKVFFRWTDSCGKVVYDSVFDYQRGFFSPLPKVKRICETFVDEIENKDSKIRQYEYLNSWQANNKIILKNGINYIRRDDSCGNRQYDAILAYSDKPIKNLILPDSLVICPQEIPFTIDISDTFRSYLWSSGSITYREKLILPQLYTVTVSDRCYSYIDSIRINIIGVPEEIALDEVYRQLCKELEKTRVETKLVYPNYIWNQTPTLNFYFIADTSNNLVTLFIPRRCDTLKDSIALNWLDPLLTPPRYTVDSSFCKRTEGAVRLTLTNRNDYLHYHWKGDSTLHIFVNTLNNTKFYARNICYEKYFDIPPFTCPLDPIGLPNAFSPNGDNLNDSWGLQGAKNIKLHSLSVYNRWGEKIFETQNPNHLWDGTYKGVLVPVGSFQYYLDYEYIPQGIRRTHRGEVTIIR